MQRGHLPEAGGVQIEHCKMVLFVRTKFSCFFNKRTKKGLQLLYSCIGIFTKCVYMSLCVCVLYHVFLSCKYICVCDIYIYVYVFTCIYIYVCVCVLLYFVYIYIYNLKNLKQK